MMLKSIWSTTVAIFLVLVSVLEIAIGIPRFAIIAEKKSMVYISSHKTYRHIPDEFTLTYLTNGLTKSNLTAIPSKALHGYLEEPAITSSSIVRHWDDATDRISAKLRLIQDEPTLLSNSFYIGAFCNPSITYFNNKYLFASRPTDWKPIMLFTWLNPSNNNNPAEFTIDEHTSYLGIGPGTTQLTGVPGYNGIGEDPRVLIVNDDTILIVRSDISTVPYRLRLEYLQYVKGNTDKDDHFKFLNDTILQPPNYDVNKNNNQKNWSPFLTKTTKQLQFIYSLHERFTIIRQISDKPNHMEIVSDVPLDGKVEQLWQYGQPRGGTPARQLGKSHYLSFFHSRAFTPNTANWFSLYMGAYIFTSDENKPYEMIAMSRVPFCQQGWYDGEWMKTYNTLYVYFPVNFYYINIKTNEILENIDIDDKDCISIECMSQYNVTLSYGYNDKKGYIATMNLGTLYHTLHFFHTGDIMKQYVNVHDIISPPKEVKHSNVSFHNGNSGIKKCGVQSLSCSGTTIDTTTAIVVNTTWSSVRNIQLVSHSQSTMIPEGGTSRGLRGSNNNHNQIINMDEKNLNKWISEQSAIAKLIDWHFQWVEQIALKHNHNMINCIDIGGKSSIFSQLMAQYDCEVDIFESKEIWLQSVKDSTCLNHVDDRVTIHHTVLSNGIHNKDVPTIDSCMSDELSGSDKYIGMIRIDTEGWEVHTIQGMKTLLSNTTIECMMITIYPDLWHSKANLTIKEGFNILHNELTEYFTLYVIDDPKTCNIGSLVLAMNPHVTIEGDVALRLIPWSYVSSVVEHIHHKNYQCNFVFLRHEYSLMKRLELIPMD